MNAATTAGHTCGWSVGQGNAAVAMPMIRLRCGGWHYPAGTTGGPWRPLSVDQVLSRTCQASGHIAWCWLSQSARCRPRTRMVQLCNVWRRQPRQCTSQSVMDFADSVRGCGFLNLLIHLQIIEWTGNSRYPNEPFFELQLSCVDRLLPKRCLNYRCFCSEVHGISKVKFGRLLEH